MSVSFESIAWLKQRLGAGCEEVPVQGDRPLMLDDPSCAYVTLSEHHQLFCVGYLGGAPVGRREHVAVCQPGQLLFGLQPVAREDATVLVLSGVSGSIVWRIPTALLFRLVGDPEGERVVGLLFDSWLALLVGTLPAAPVPTRGLALSAGEQCDVDGTQSIRATEGVAWVAPAKPPSLYYGMELKKFRALAECWPLTEQAWAVPEAGHLRIWKTTELLRASGGAGFADSFYAFVISVVARRRATLAATRLKRDRASRHTEQRFVSESLTLLAAIGRGERIEEETAAGTEPFERACRTIANFLEIDAPRIVKPLGPALSQMQAALSRLTGVRTRGVLLEKGWSNNDGGPLLGFLLDGEDTLFPVALLPTAGGYVVHDSRRQQPQKVSAELANTLHPQAYQFYAPMPNRPVGPLEVLRFSSRRARRDVVFALGVGMATGSVGTLIPLLTAQVFDRIIPGAERGLLRELTLVLVGVYGGLLLFDLARGFCLVRAQTRMDATLEAAVWDRLLNLPLPFFRNYSAGDLAARAAGIGHIREVLAGATLSVLLSGLFSIWNFGLLFVIDPKLALAATLLVVVAGSVAAMAAYAGLQRQRKVAELDGKIGGLLLQLLGGIAKLRVTGSENRAFGVWAKLFARRRDADLGAERVNLRVSVFQGSFPIVCSMVLFWMLSGEGGQKLSTGQFLAFSSAFGVFLAAILDVIETALQSLSVVPMYERAKPILVAPVESQGKSDVRTAIRGALELTHVSFRYETAGPLIVDDVSFRIEANQFVAIVGPSGSGKSTLLRILLGFEECSEGGVFYDGQALSQLDVRSVRQQTGVVLQNSRVMAGDIFTNIVGNTGLGIDEAWRAARGAAFDKDVESMPMGMHTVIAQGGGTLSGGQRQRLLIARALASEPKILFFDEATSALDNMTQSQVSKSLEALRVTRIVIAHRLSTIEHADKIVVLERGRIVQMGSFSELMRVEGTFRQLALRQTI
jgi:NHLM bacteriocin system ABC transporter ATP-binding protein